MSGRAEVGWESFVRRFVEDGEAGIFHIITVEGWRQVSGTGMRVL